MISEVKAYIEITRPLNVFIGGLSVLIAIMIAGGHMPLSKIFIVCFSAALVMAGGNTINDYYDVAIDRINKPQRPLPSGRMAAKSAFKFSIILFVFGNFLAILAHLILAIIAVSISIGLWIYSAYLKRTVLYGNLLVSMFAALVFIYGGIAAANWHVTLFPAAFAFLFHFGREIIKDIEDKSADQANSVVTFPIRYGLKPALCLTTGVFLLLIFVTIIPYILDIYGQKYLNVVLWGVDFVIAVSLILMWIYPYPKFLNRISFALKIDMFVGLLAIYVEVPK